ncbi:MAG TPA: radical SAM protein [Candidatus Colwellbacteria bacterium]|jgi:cyclic pyranopterin phosphate synthase|nr:radical SAM protein [Candidatus Colwellbacteria bacterium]
MAKKDKISKSVIFTGYECNNHCRFCMEQDKRNLPIRTAVEVKKEIAAAKKRGSTYLELIGGETTIRPDFTDIVGFAKKVGFKTIMIATNGRMFSYEPVAESLIEAGINSVVFSIHGHTAKIHDYLTQVPGSFDQLRKGLTNIRSIIKRKNLKMHLGSNTTVVKQNFRYLPQIGKFILDQGIKDSEFIFVDCNEGGARRYFEALVPKISEAAPHIRKCLDIGNKAGAVHWDIRYVPLCHFPDHLDRISELHEINIFNTEHIAQDFVDFDALESRKKWARKKTLRCKGCALYNSCEGIWVEYLKRYGDEELSPIKHISPRQKKMLFP